jgi:hypothetical protein
MLHSDGPHRLRIFRLSPDRGRDRHWRRPAVEWWVGGRRQEGSHRLGERVRAVAHGDQLLLPPHAAVQVEDLLQELILVLQQPRPKARKPLTAQYRPRGSNWSLHRG